MKPRLLVAYSNGSVFTATTRDYLESFRRFSAFEVSYLHVTHGAEPAVDLADFDAVLNSYCARLCFPGYVSEAFQRQLQDYRGVKALVVQDEYDDTEVLRSAIERLGFGLVLSAVPTAQRERVYPASRFPGVRFEQVLTGYVPPELEAPLERVPVAARSREVGYRGRDLGVRYGRLAHLKAEVGRRMRAACERRGFPHDIALDEASRIYGERWFGWLAGLRVVLGSESGSNVFDFDGSIARECREADVAGRRIEDGTAARIRELDAEFEMGQISARVFEAAALGTPMALVRGLYSGFLEPEVHYIPIEPDLDGLDELISRFDDLESLQRMADRAHADLVASGRFSYRELVTGVESLILQQLAARRQPLPTCLGAGRDLRRNDPRREETTPMPRGLAAFHRRQALIAGLTEIWAVATALPFLVRRLRTRGGGEGPAGLPRELPPVVRFLMPLAALVLVQLRRFPRLHAFAEKVLRRLGRVVPDASRDEESPACETRPPVAGPSHGRCGARDD